MDTSLRFGVLCRFTAYVAVDRSEVVNPGGQVHSVVQPVEQPEGWNMQATTLAAGIAPAACAAPLALDAARRMRGAPRPAAPQALRCAPPGGAAGARKCAEIPPELLAGQPKARKREAPPRGETSTDSEVCRGMPQDRESREVARGGEGPGVVRRLLDLFRGRGKKGKKAAVPPIDRTPFRQRSADLLREVQAAGGGDAAAQLAVLRAVIDRIEKLFEDLVAAGDRHPAVQRLGEVVLALRAFLVESAPPDVAVRSLWGRTEAALRDCLALVPEPPAAPAEQREGFWK